MNGPPQPQLRPLGTVEILDAAWVLLRRHWTLFYAASSVGSLPPVLLTLYYFRWLGTLVEGTDPGRFYRGTALWAAAMAAAWALHSLARSAVTGLALAEARGEPLSLARAWRGAYRNAGGSGFVGLAALAGAWLAAPLLVAPGLLLALGWWVARPVLLEEGRPYAAALRRSWRLVRGYRGKSLGLWLLFAGLWLLTTLNLMLAARFLLQAGSTLLGLDAGPLLALLRLSNLPFALFLLSLVFVLLDPLKTIADAVLYLDLRIRREGADLQERLRALRSAAPAALLLLLLVPAAPARGDSVEEYAARIRALRREVRAAGEPDQVSPRLVGELEHLVVELPEGGRMSVENGWLRQSLGSWESRGDKVALLRRLDALERSLAAPPAPAAAQPDPQGALRQLLQEPEFQPLAERPELRDLARRVDLSRPRTWWSEFWKWVRENWLRPRDRPAPAPAGGANWNLAYLEPVFYALLALTLLYVLALLVRWFIERPLADARRARVAVASAPLESSLTENALEHTVDQWEEFARQWLGRGEVRQAVRALYLATLVHLHRERRIDYNRALTNWSYVREFRGGPEQQSRFRLLTQTFDEVWYGERPLAESQYRLFEQNARDLGTPAPA